MLCKWLAQFEAFNISTGSTRDRGVLKWAEPKFEIATTLLHLAKGRAIQIPVETRELLQGYAVYLLENNGGVETAPTGSKYKMVGANEAHHQPFYPTGDGLGLPLHADYHSHWAVCMFLVVWVKCTTAQERQTLSLDST